MCHELRELVTNFQLTALFIDEIHEVLLLVDCVGLVDVLGGNTQRSIEIRVDFDWRRPLHGWLHAPKKGDRPSNLQVGRNSPDVFLFVGNDVLSFAEVGSSSVSVKTSAHEPSTRSSTVFARDKSQVLLEVDAVDCHESVNHRHSEWSELNLAKLGQHHVVECELGDVVNTVGEEHRKVWHARG